jgi:ribosomal protein S18 acetylase RimI-like enzyme
MNIEVKLANYLDKEQAIDIGYLLDVYSQDQMGGSQPLSESVRSNLANELSKLPHAFSVICYVNNKPAGLVNCFEAFSTFKCKPLINIHDVVVVNEFRGLGLSQKMLSKVEEIAKLKGCCKITLEVLEGNKVAQNSYIKFGFAGYELDPVMGKALFWQRNI